MTEIVRRPGGVVARQTLGIKARDLATASGVAEVTLSTSAGKMFATPSRVSGATEVEVFAGGAIRRIPATGTTELEGLPVADYLFCARVPNGKWNRGGLFRSNPFFEDVAPDISTPTISPSSGNLTTTFSAGFTFSGGFPAPTITYQWKLNGTAISGATSRNYRSVASGTLTCDITATNRAGTETITTPGVTLAGASARPAANITVTSGGSTTIAAAMNAAAPAAGVEYIIDVAPGTYARVTPAANFAKTGFVRVRAQDPENPPVIRGFNLDNCRRVILDGLVIEGNNVITETTDGVNHPAVDSFWGSEGIPAKGAQQFTMTDCVMRRWSIHLDIRRCRDTNILWCRFEENSIDAVRLYYNATNVLIKGCIFRNPKPFWNSYEDGNRHPDMIQMESSVRIGNNLFGPPEPSENVTIEDCYFSTLDEYHQAIFCFAEENVANSLSAATRAHKNLTVRDCYFQMAHPHAISLSCQDGAKIERCLIRDWPGGITWRTPAASWRPTISIAGDTVNSSITNVVANRAIWPFGRNVGQVSDYTVTDFVQSATAVPTGWASTLVAQDLIGPYQRGLDPVDTTPAPAATSNLSSIDLGDGVTVTLSKAMPCGQYWNGDWFIVNVSGSGGFNITSITPNSEQRAGNATWRHGLMRNPASGQNGLDGWTAFGSTAYRSTYTHTLNICPGISGRPAVAFTAGQEGSLVKAVGRDTLYPSDTAGATPIEHMKILTVVNAVPLEGSFRPSPHSAVTSKAAPARVDQLRLDLIPRTTVSGLPTSGTYTLAAALDSVRGPWQTWLGAAHVVHQLWPRTSTNGVTEEAMYAPILGPQLMNAYARLVHSGTATNDFTELARRIVQIGLDYGSVPTTTSLTSSFWPILHAQPLIVACALLPGLSVGNSALAARVGSIAPGSDPWDINTGTEGRAVYRFVQAIDVTDGANPAKTNSYIPIEGRKPQDYHPDGDPAWPRHWPTLTEHIGQVHRYVIGRSGVGTQPDMRYRPIQSITDIGLAVSLLLGTKGGGAPVASVPALFAYADKLVEWRRGHFAGTWDMTDGVELDSSGQDWAWPAQWMVDFYDAMRPLATAAAYISTPEQPLPPLLTKPASGQMRIQRRNFRPANGSTITAWQYRTRVIASRSDANVYAAWSGGWTSFSGDITLTGLAAGIYQVQVRAQNSVGWSPASTHIPSKGNSSDTAYRGVIDI